MQNLTFAQFRAANVTRCLKWHPRGINSWSLSDWLTAIAGELGELASLVKMMNRERDGLPGNKFSPTDKDVADECADVLTYLDLFAHAAGVDLGHAVAEKFNEVSERVGFSDRLQVPGAVPIPPPVSLSDRMESQRREFDACADLASQYRRITLMPIVDDDYSEVRHGYESALRVFLNACRDNGRAI